MNNQNPASPVRTAVEIAVSLFLAFALIWWCFEIIRPFLTIVVWAAIIAVACYTPFESLVRKLGGRRKLAATIFALLGLVIIVLPAYLFADSLIGSAGQIRTALETGTANIPPPNESVKSWPLVGPKLYENWSSAAFSLSSWLEEHMDQVKPIVSTLVGRFVSIGLTVLQFIVSVLIAAALLATSTPLEGAARRIALRLSPKDGSEMLALTTATIRSVTVGVLGIAFIQAVAGGAGMLIMGIPFAGVWALVILVLAIAQLPPLLVLLPVAIYAFSLNDNVMANSIFAAWCVLVSISDSFLKPLLLGRGVNAPMLVILLGAIGGMIQYGIIGLFLGAVVLALGYTLFQAWLADDGTSEGNVEEGGADAQVDA